MAKDSEHEEKKLANNLTDEENKMSIPDGGWGWMVVFGSFMIHVIADGITYSLGIFYSEWVQYFRSSKGTTAWVGSLVPATTYLVGPLAGALTSVYGCRKVSVVGSIITAVGFIISIFATDVYYLYFSFGILGGLGIGLVYLPAIVCVGFYFEKRRAFATGLAVCGAGIGTFVFAPLTQFLLQQYNWKGAVLIESGLMLNCIICGLLFRSLPGMGSSPKTELKEKGNTKNGNKELADLHANGFKLKQPIPTTRDIANLAKSDSVLVTGRYGPSLRSHPSKEVFTSGTIFNLPVFQSQASIYSLSMMSLHEQGVEGKVGCWDETIFMFKQTLDPSLLKNMSFIIFLLSNLLCSIGYIIPYIYIHDHATGMGRTPYESSMLISVIGITNTVGRIFFGYLSDSPRINRIILYGMALVICGVATCIYPFCYNYPLMMTFAIVFGIFTGVYVSITSVVLVDLLGLEKLTNSFGLTLLFQGVATLIGPPAAGWLFDATKVYDYSFYLAGLSLGIGGLMQFLIPPAKKYQEGKLERTKPARQELVYGELPKIIVTVDENDDTSNQAAAEL